jgi:hypothetical protein
MSQKTLNETLYMIAVCSLALLIGTVVAFSMGA